METKATKREVKQEVKNKVRTFATSSRSGITLTRKSITE